MSAHIPHAARIAALSILAASILAPAAGAGRYSLASPLGAGVGQPESQPVTTCHQYCGADVLTRGSQAPATRSLVRTELVSGSDGFHWADAAIGFAIGIGGTVALLAVETGRRERMRHASSAS